MARTEQAGGRRRTDKRGSILRGALIVFARDGYARASIDAIAREADVSTRTIYNHFQDKAALFEVVVQESATNVAEAQLAVIDKYLRKVTDLEADLIEFGRVWATPNQDYADHFAMVRQINAEVGHIPETALHAWLETGPRRVQRALAERMAALAEQGLLRTDAPEQTAVHFVQLVAGEINGRSFHGALPLPAEEIARISDAGVRAFLDGYRS